MQNADGLQFVLRAYTPLPIAKTPDQVLIESIVRGDKRALELLFARHRVRIYRFVLRLAGNAALAEDVVSEVFLEVWRSADRFRARSQVSTWLFAIARNKALQALRSRSDSRLDDNKVTAIADTTDDPEAALHQRSRGAIIRKCLSQLPPAQREIVDLVYYHEKSVAEVAQIIGIPTGTVKSRMFHARSQIAGLLARAGVDGLQDC